MKHRRRQFRLGGLVFAGAAAAVLVVASGLYLLNHGHPFIADAFNWTLTLGFGYAFRNDGVQ